MQKIPFHYYKNWDEGTFILWKPVGGLQEHVKLRAQPATSLQMLALRLKKAFK